MSATGRKLRKFVDKFGGWGLNYFCPGCKSPHGVYIKRGDGKTGPSWSFDGNFDAPTFGPSIRCFTTRDTGRKDAQGKAVTEQLTLCHHFVKKGQIEFCADSPHALKGKTVELPDWPYAAGTYAGIEDG